MSDLYIPRISLHISSSRTGRPIVGIYNSLTDTWMWKLGLRPQYSFSGNICFKFSAFCLCSAASSNFQIYFCFHMFLLQVCSRKKVEPSALRVWYWMIYRGPGFLAVVWFGSSPTPSPPPVSKSRPATHRKTKKERQFADGRRGKGWARSRIIRPLESLVLYKSFNNLCVGRLLC